MLQKTVKESPDSVDYLVVSRIVGFAVEKNHSTFCKCSAHPFVHHGKGVFEKVSSELLYGWLHQLKDFPVELYGKTPYNSIIVVRIPT